MGRVAELDGVRTIAVMLVIACHYRAFANSFWGLPAYGWIGVEIFFVLSGFLITTILLQLKTSPSPYRVFYLRRALRIFPPYYAMIVLATLAWWLYGGEVDALTLRIFAFFRTSLAGEERVTGAVLKAIRTGIFPDCFAPTATPPMQLVRFIDLRGVLGPAWSLSIEEWFYVLWAPVVLLFSRKNIVYATVVATIVPFILRWLGHDSTYGWYFDFGSRFDTLAAGAMLALWRNRRSSLPRRAQRKGDAVIAGATIVACGLLAVLLASNWPVLGREIRYSRNIAAFFTPLVGMIFAGALSWILSRAGQQNLVCRALRSRAMVYVGVRSYVIYLIHIPCYFVAWRSIGPAMPGLTGDWVIAVVSALASVAIAAASWKYMETPILRFKDRISPVKPVALAATA